MSKKPAASPNGNTRTSAVALLEAFNPTTRTSDRAVWLVVAVATVLLILFAWMHMGVAMRIMSTNRDIQEATVKLRSLERQNEMVVRDIAVAESQQAMAQRAAELGYASQTPLYLPLSGLAGQSAPPDVQTAGEPDPAAAQAAARHPAAEFLLQAGAEEGTP